MTSISPMLALFIVITDETYSKYSLKFEYFFKSAVPAGLRLIAIRNFPQLSSLEFKQLGVQQFSRSYFPRRSTASGVESPIATVGTSIATLGNSTAGRLGCRQVVELTSRAAWKKLLPTGPTKRRNGLQSGSKNSTRI